MITVCGHYGGLFARLVRTEKQQEMGKVKRKNETKETKKGGVKKKKRHKTYSERAREMLGNQVRNAQVAHAPKLPSKHLQRMVYAICDSVCSEAAPTRFSLRARIHANEMETQLMANLCRRLDTVRSFSNRKWMKSSAIDALMRFSPGTLTMFVVPPIPGKES